MDNEVYKTHPFEQAGLGVAPFRFVRVERKIYRACPGAPGQPGGTCQYCGESIVECCYIRDAEGTEFYVGNVCVEKTYDRKLIDPLKAELKKLRHVAEMERIGVAKSEYTQPEIANRLKAMNHPDAYHAARGRDAYSYVDFLFRNGGHSGQLKATRLVDKVKQGKDIGASPEEVEASLKAQAESIVVQQSWQEREAKREAIAREANEWILQVLKLQNGSEFIRSMIDQLERFPISSMSLRQQRVLGEIFAKSKGRGGSVAYYNGLAEFETRVQQVAESVGA